MNPILFEVPSQIETSRLILRAPRQKGDGIVVNNAIRASFTELKAWLPFAQTIPEVEETEINLRIAHVKFLKREAFRFLLFEKENNDFVGTASLQDIDWDIPSCQIGYWMNTAFTGKGYMTEAVQELTNLALNTISCRRAEIRCETENSKSRAIPEKLGFRLEGILRNEDLSADGKRLTDTCIYSVIK